RRRRRRCRPLARRWPLAVRDPFEEADGGDPDHRLARLVGPVQVDLGRETPVVVTVRIVEDLPDPPDVPVAVVDHQHRRPARIGPGTDLAVLGEVRPQRVRPRIGIPVRLRVQFAQLLPVTQGSELDPAEHRISYQYAESSAVACYRWGSLIKLGLTPWTALGLIRVS